MTDTRSARFSVEAEGRGRSALSRRLGAGDDQELLLAKFAVLDELYASPDHSAGSLAEVTATALAAIAPACCAAVSVKDPNGLRVNAVTSSLAGDVERAQGQLGAGPSLEVLTLGRSHSALLSTCPSVAEPDRPEALTQRLRGLGVGAVLSLRITTGLPDTRAALTVAAPAGRTFDEDSFLDALTVARQAQGAVGADQVTHLNRALVTSRDLGVAIGILMSRYRLTRDDAVRMLKKASQDRNRKANVLALQIIEIGELPSSPTH